MTRYWCELAWLGGETAAAGVVVEIDGERIESVEAGVDAPPTGATRLDGITIPGMANAHSHAFQRALRGRTHSGSGDFWTWREAMYGRAARLDPHLYLALARATFGEMALAGITCVGEFHYLHHAPGGVPYSNPNEMGEALLQAAREAGIRITLLDACYLHGGIGQELDDVQRRFSDGGAERWAERVGELASGDGARIGAAVHSVRAVDPDSAATVAAWSGERDLPSDPGRCTPTSRSSRPRTRRVSRRTRRRQPRCSSGRERSASDSQRCMGRISTIATSRSSGRQARRAACARRPSAIWPTGSVRRRGWGARESG